MKSNNIEHPSDVFSDCDFEMDLGQLMEKIFCIDIIDIHVSL